MEFRLQEAAFVDIRHSDAPAGGATAPIKCRAYRNSSWARSDNSRLDKLSSRRATAGRKAVFNRAFCRRVRAARKAAGLTQSAIARALRVTPAAYEKYESRTPLPHHLVGCFAALTGSEIQRLFASVQREQGIMSALDTSGRR
jgi:DNA-binding transcriptional regulator YiaG